MDNKNRDEYLALSKYDGRPKADKNKDFASFEQGGEYYFALLMGGKAFLRSEGYSSDKSRDNGIESVIKNRDKEERWSVKENGGKYFLSLKAGNHQEIGLSGAYNSEADAKAALASWLKGGSGSGVVAAAAGMAAGASKDVLQEEDKEDDYLPTKEYEGKTINDKRNNVALFKHENGQYYFALYTKDGKVKLRSEGFETAKNRDKELAGVIKYHNDDKMYQTLERGKFYMMVLKDETGREVGRSPLLKRKAPVAGDKKTVKGETKTTTTSTKSSAGSMGLAAGGGMLTGRIISESRREIGEKRNQIGETRNVVGEKRNVVGEKRNVVGEKRNTLSSTKSKVREDEYLPCDSYKGHKVSDEKNRVAKFKGKDGLHYFAVYNKDGSVRLRSEGFKNEGELSTALKAVIAGMETEKMYKTIKKGKYYLNILKDKSGKEIARSCASAKVARLVAPPPPPPPPPKPKPVAVKKTPPPPPPPPKKVPVAAPVAAATVAEKGGCFKWWMLLPLLLLLLIPLWLKFCAAAPVPVAAPVVAPAVVATPPPPPPPPPAPVCNCDDLTHPVFKIPSGRAPKTTTRLGLAPEYGNISALDGAGFYNKLKRGYDRSAREKRFLDGIFMQMGYENGFKDADASLFTSVTVPRGVSGNLGMKSNHQTVHRKLDPVSAKDLQAFRVKAKNACNLHFMKTCGNHFFYNDCE